MSTLYSRAPGSTPSRRIARIRASAEASSSAAKYAAAAAVYAAPSGLSRDASGSPRVCKNAKSSSKSRQTSTAATESDAARAAESPPRNLRRRASALPSALITSVYERSVGNLADSCGVSVTEKPLTPTSSARA